MCGKRWCSAVRPAWGGCDLASQAPLPHCLDGQGLQTDAAGNLLCVTLQRSTLKAPLPAAGCGLGQALSYMPGLQQIICRDDKVDVYAAGSSASLHQRIDELTRQIQHPGGAGWTFIPQQRRLPEQ